MAIEEVTLLWLDLEMTGLLVETDRILEVAVIVTDAKRQEKATFEDVVFQSQEVLDAMDDWCKKQHGESGLTKRVASGVSEAELDDKLCALVEKHVSKGRPILAGNSIAQDRRFIDRYLPKFSARLHYRMLDVSSFKIIFENVYGIKYKKENKHRAIDDIRESMAELEFYLQHISPVPLFKEGGE